MTTTSSNKSKKNSNKKKSKDNSSNTNSNSRNNNNIHQDDNKASLPVPRHSTRLYAIREGLALPGRPGYLYFGRCATLPYVVDAARKLAEEVEYETPPPLEREEEAEGGHIS